VSRPEGERIATLEVEMRELRSDAREVMDVARRNRSDLDDVMSTLRRLTLLEKAGRSEAKGRQRRLELRLQVLSFFVLVAALIEPFLYHAATGK
jgi:uncharacterized protein (UPF0335 family)